jgi:hypothetical protein
MESNMTVFIYVDTSKEVGDVDHIKALAITDAAEKWFEENDPEGVASVRFWNRWNKGPTASNLGTNAIRSRFPW